jgi:hypothetical protein
MAIIRSSFRIPKPKKAYEFADFKREVMQVAKNLGACKGVRDDIRNATKVTDILWLIEQHCDWLCGVGVLDYSDECANMLLAHGWRSQELFIGREPTTRLYKNL